jgi:hypothetical protein
MIHGKLDVDIDLEDRTKPKDDDEEEKDEEDQGQIKCPSCGYFLPAKTKKCPLCNEDIDLGRPEATLEEKDFEMIEVRLKQTPKNEQIPVPEKKPPYQQKYHWVRYGFEDEKVNFRRDYNVSNSGDFTSVVFTVFCKGQKVYVAAKDFAPRVHMTFSLFRSWESAIKEGEQWLAQDMTGYGLLSKTWHDDPSSEAQHVAIRRKMDSLSGITLSTHTVEDMTKYEASCAMRVTKLYYNLKDINRDLWEQMKAGKIDTADIEA